MADDFLVPRTNFLSFLELGPDVSLNFSFWVRFLNEHSLVHAALIANTILNVDLLRQVWTTAVNSSNPSLGFSFELGTRRIRIFEEDLNEVLGFPTENFEDDPDESDIIAFFYGIRCNTTLDGDIPSKLYNSMLPKEWNLFFNMLSYVFSTKTSGFHGITKLVKTLGFAVATNLRINFGRLIMGQILKKLKTRNYLYPRFLHLVLNRKLSHALMATFPNPEQINSQVLSSIILPRLEKSKNYLNCHRAVLTKFMHNYLLDVALLALSLTTCRNPLKK